MFREIFESYPGSYQAVVEEDEGFIPVPHREKPKIYISADTIFKVRTLISLDPLTRHKKAF